MKFAAKQAKPGNLYVIISQADGHKPRQDLAAIRMADMVLAVIGLTLAAPVVLACMAVVKLTSPGPAIFAQTRVGRQLRTFTCYKLRTMYVDTRSVASHDVAASAVTPVGRILRRIKFDELPQLWNVLVGEMSFVGPRPCLEGQAELIALRAARGVYVVRPGITGIGQIQDCDMSDPERLSLLDAQWINTMSLGLYCKLILMTALGRGQGDRVRG